MPKKAKNSPVDYEELGRMMESIYESHYANRWRAYRMSFAKGVIAGFGGVIGATIVVALFAWVLSLFDQVTFLKDFTVDVRHTIQDTNK